MTVYNRAVIMSVQYLDCINLSSLPKKNCFVMILKINYIHCFYRYYTCNKYSMVIVGGRVIAIISVFMTIGLTLRGM